MESENSVGGKTEGAPNVPPNSCHINKTHSQGETKWKRGIDGKIQESKREPVIHMSEQTWVRSGNETARRRENRACTLLDKYTLTPLHVFVLERLLRNVWVHILISDYWSYTRTIWAKFKTFLKKKRQIWDYMGKIWSRRLKIIQFLSAMSSRGKKKILKRFDLLFFFPMFYLDS